MKRLISAYVAAFLLISVFVSALGTPAARAAGTIYIRADGSVDPPTAPILNEGNVEYTFTADIFDSIVVERSGIIIDGAGYKLQGPGNDTGVYGAGILNVTIRNIIIRDFGYGIWLEASANYNSIIGNLIIANAWYGITLSYCSHNTILGNTIAENGGGIVLVMSTENSLFHNNFIGNPQQVAVEGALPNVWDNGYPIGGNFWSDHQGIDANSGPDQSAPGSDGIADTPYIIDGYNQDNYPLMGTLGPSTPPGDNVVVFPTGDVCVTFETVTAEGFTTAFKLPEGPLPPPGFTTMQYYIIATTAAYAGSVSIKIIYPMLPGTLGEAPLQESWHLLQCNMLEGDVDEDFDVDIFDIVRMAIAYGTHSGAPGFDPPCDLDRDGDVDIFDLVRAAGNYGDVWDPLTGWSDITTHVDVDNSSIFGVTKHLSIFGVTKR